MYNNLELPPNFTYQTLAEIMMQIAQNTHLTEGSLLQIVKDKGGFKPDQTIPLMVIVQQLSLMIKSLDGKRLFPYGNQQQVEDLFRQCLTHLYGDAEPAETNFWKEEMLPKDLKEEFENEADKITEAHMNKMMSSSDPHLEEFMKMFSDAFALQENAKGANIAKSAN